MKCNSVEDRMVGVSGDVFTQTQKQIAVKTISMSMVGNTKNIYSGPGTGSISFTVLKDDPDWQDIETGEEYDVCVDEGNEDE